MRLWLSEDVHHHTGRYLIEGAIDANGQAARRARGLWRSRAPTEDRIVILTMLCAGVARPLRTIGARDCLGTAAHRAQRRIVVHAMLRARWTGALTAVLTRDGFASPQCARCAPAVKGRVREAALRALRALKRGPVAARELRRLSQSVPAEHLLRAPKRNRLWACGCLFARANKA